MIQSVFNNYVGNYAGIIYSEFHKSDTCTAPIDIECVYERCGDYSHKDGRRTNNAEKAYKHFRR